MTTLRVPEMMCQNCVKRITNALTPTGMKFTVSLESKTVEVEDGEANVKQAVAALADVGFDAAP